MALHRHLAGLAELEQQLSATLLAGGDTVSVRACVVATTISAMRCTQFSLPDLARWHQNPSCSNRTRAGQQWC